MSNSNRNNSQNIKLDLLDGIPYKLYLDLQSTCGCTAFAAAQAAGFDIANLTMQWGVAWKNGETEQEIKYLPVYHFDIPEDQKVVKTKNMLMTDGAPEDMPENLSDDAGSESYQLDVSEKICDMVYVILTSTGDFTGNFRILRAC